MQWSAEMAGRAAEFFAGIGLVGKALELEGWKVLFANDIDPKKKLVFEQNFPGTRFVLEDIAKLRAKDIPRVDLATASFPCIDLSLAGNRAGLSGNHSSVFWHFARLLKEMKKQRPQKVLIENVTGLLSSHSGADLRAIIMVLNSLGYVCDLLIVDAAYFLPQSRPRLFITGEICQPDRPFVVQEHPFRPNSLNTFILRNSDLKWRLHELPFVGHRKANLANYLDSFLSDDPVWWNEDRKQHLHGQMNELHQAKLQMLARLPGTNFATVYKRIREGKCRAELRTDGLSGCLRTPRGGSSKQFVIQAGNGKWQVRNMSVRECARLQGAPNFRLNVPDNIALLGFGDAVCVPVVQWVLRYCLKNNGKQKVQPKQRKAIAQVCAD
jgi:DNA (cytosine-5)-methyltransferase 1